MQAPCVLQGGTTEEAAECTLQISADWRHMAAVNATPDTHMNNKDPSSVLNACDTIGLVGVTCKKKKKHHVIKTVCDGNVYPYVKDTWSSLTGKRQKTKQNTSNKKQASACM